MTRWRLLLLFIASFSLSMMANLPASLVLSWAGPALQRAGLSTSSASATGTLWQGQIENLTYRRLQVPRIAWDWHASDVLRGNLGSDVVVKLAGPGAHQLTADVRYRPLAAKLEIRDLQGSADLAIASQLGLVPADFVTGELLANIRLLVLEDGVPRTLDGQGALQNLGNLYLPGIALGSYQARFATEDETIVGRFSDLDAPVETRGEFTLSADGRYEVNARLRPRDNAPPILVSGLDFLGPADNEGFKRFDTTGRL